MKSVILSIIFMVLGITAYGHQGSHSQSEHLTFAQGAYHAHVEWTVGPLVSDYSTLSLHWRSGVDHQIIAAPGNFSVELFMPSMGHGSSPTTVEAQNDGSYKVSGVFFSMPGDWLVKVVLNEADGVQETQAFTLLIEGAGHQH